MSKDILYLASSSESRKKLLEDIDINFKVVTHNADERAVNLKDDFNSYVLDIAKEKMKHVDLPNGSEGQIIFVLTADTLVYTKDSGTILGKPSDIQDAKRMLRLLRQEKVKLVTGCCLEKKIFKNNIWQNKHKNHFITVSFVDFYIDEQELDLFFKKFPQALKAAGACMIEDYGQRFCKSIEGSYSNIIGLPLFEIVQALKQMNFKF
ncbi:hypothetical protein GF385_02805 [Candidatus Dependentiae bacterium]|nr:hypothetical protein [Candidatus Dependentiae bacterium]